MPWAAAAAKPGMVAVHGGIHRTVPSVLKKRRVAEITPDSIDAHDTFIWAKSATATL